MNYIHRNFCPITNEKEFELLSESKYPVFAGCVDVTELNTDLVANQKWVIYKSGVIALKELIPLEILYKNGHDAGFVGNIWENHHNEFANFVLKTSPKNVLEIGGGHGKLSKNCLEKNQKINWTIIEPNSTNKSNKVKYIDGYFENYDINGDFDCIVHSHLFEHIYEPNVFLKKCYNILNNRGGGQMVFSLPNMQKWLENKWTNCLNFEHTIFINENVIEFLLNNNNFSIIDKKYFSNHSIFIRAEINNNLIKNKLNIDYNDNKYLFLDMQNHYSNLVEKLNNIIRKTNKEIYLFGAHLFSQYLLYNGLDNKKIKNILDNNLNKQGKRLYGTNLIVQSPKILQNNTNSIVILCAGAYNEEIQRDIQENINHKIEILKF